mgnify:CR=1 FL=1
MVLINNNINKIIFILKIEIISNKMIYIEHYFSTKMNNIIENVKITLPKNYENANFNVIDSVNSDNNICDDINNINNNNNVVKSLVEISETLLDNFFPDKLENFLFDILHKLQSDYIVVTSCNNKNYKKNFIQIQTRINYYFYDTRTCELFSSE